MPRTVVGLTARPKPSPHTLANAPSSNEHRPGVAPPQHENRPAGQSPSMSPVSLPAGVPDLGETPKLAAARRAFPLDLCRFWSAAALPDDGAG